MSWQRFECKIDQMAKNKKLFRPFPTSIVILHKRPRVYYAPYPVYNGYSSKTRDSFFNMSTKRAVPFFRLLRWTFTNVFLVTNTQGYCYWHWRNSYERSIFVFLKQHNITHHTVVVILKENKITKTVRIAIIIILLFTFCLINIWSLWLSFEEGWISIRFSPKNCQNDFKYNQGRQEDKKTRMLPKAPSQ